MRNGSFSINIEDMGNAAFADAPREEVARILRELAEKIESGREVGSVLDINGNKVGSWSLDLPEQESQSQRHR